MAINWYLKRTGQAFLTVFAVFNFTFILIHQLPGGPMAYLMSLLYQSGDSGKSTEELMEIAQSYININPNEPLSQQYIDYTTAVLRGDLGTSVWYGEPVTQIFAQAIPWTVYLFSQALLLTFLIGIILGSIIAYYEGSRFDAAATIYSIVSTSIPYYVLGILLVFTFGHLWGVFPTKGRYDNLITPGPNWSFISSVIYHSILPIASVVITGLGGWALGMRANSIQELGKDYIRVARLRGLEDKRIATRYVGRNAILPLYTGVLISIGGVFGGSVILETIFFYKGVGWYLFKGISARDYPLMMGGFMVITIAVVVGIFIADLTYGLLDPRAKTKDTETYGGAGILGSLSLASIGAKLRRVIHRDQSPTLSEKDPEVERGEFIPEGIEEETDTLSRWERLSVNFDEFVVTPLGILLEDWRARIGLAIFTAYAFMATVGVVVLPRPKTNIQSRYVTPFQTAQYPLGTDGSGQGIFTMIVHATPYILKMVIAGAIFAILIGAFVGIVSGYVGGLVDSTLMTFTDMLLTIPGLPLVIVLAFFIEPTNPYVVGIILAVNNWTGLARSLRSQVLTLRDADYVEASRFMDLSTMRIAYKDILPNLMPLIAVNFVNASRRIIFESVGLYFLGIISATKPNWGVMMNMAYQGGGALYNLSSFHWIFFPMITIVIFSFGAIMLAQGGDRIFNPRVRARHSSASEGETEEDEGDHTVAPASPH